MATEIRLVGEQIQRATEAQRETPVSVTDPSVSRFFVGQLPATVTEEELRKRFQSFGDVKGVVKVYQGEGGIDPGKFRGFAYIDVALTMQPVEVSKLLNNTKWRGSVIRVRRARVHFAKRYFYAYTPKPRAPVKDPNENDNEDDSADDDDDEEGGVDIPTEANHGADPNNQTIDAETNSGVGGVGGVDADGNPSKDTEQPQPESKKRKREPKNLLRISKPEYGRRGRLVIVNLDRQKSKKFDSDDEGTDYTPPHKKVTPQQTPHKKITPQQTPHKSEANTTTPWQKESTTSTPQRKESTTSTPQRKESTTSTPQQKESITSTPQHKESTASTPQQKESITSTPQHKESTTSKPQHKTKAKPDNQDVIMTDQPPPPPTPAPRGVHINTNLRSLVFGLSSSATAPNFSSASTLDSAQTSTPNPSTTTTTTPTPTPTPTTTANNNKTTNKNINALFSVVRDAENSIPSFGLFSSSTPATSFRLLADSGTEQDSNVKKSVAPPKQQPKPKKKANTLIAPRKFDAAQFVRHQTPDALEAKWQKAREQASRLVTAQAKQAQRRKSAPQKSSASVGTQPKNAEHEWL